MKELFTETSLLETACKSSKITKLMFNIMSRIIFSGLMLILLSKFQTLVFLKELMTARNIFA